MNNLEREKELWLFPEEINKDKATGFKHTKVKNIKLYGLDSNLNDVETTVMVPLVLSDFFAETDGMCSLVLQDSAELKTWSSTLRWVVEHLQENIDEMVADEVCGFEEMFNDTLDSFLDQLGLVENSNFSRKLFDDDSFMTSSVYKNNKNHKLKLAENEDGRELCICAVYADEVVWIIQTLLTCVCGYAVCITYYDKDTETTDEVDESANEVDLELLNDITLDDEIKIEDNIQDILKQAVEMIFKSVIVDDVYAKDLINVIGVVTEKRNVLQQHWIDIKLKSLDK